jgi:PleD family two-component response regulator
MSFGLAMARAGEAVESLRMRADGALYRAKQEGRDRLIVADGALPEAPVT